MHQGRTVRTLAGCAAALPAGGGRGARALQPRPLGGGAGGTPGRAGALVSCGPLAPGVPSAGRRLHRAHLGAGHRPAAAVDGAAAAGGRDVPTRGGPPGAPGFSRAHPSGRGHGLDVPAVAPARARPGGVRPAAHAGAARDAGAGGGRTARVDAPCPGARARSIVVGALHRVPERRGAGALDASLRRAVGAGSGQRLGRSLGGAGACGGRAGHRGGRGGAASLGGRGRARADARGAVEGGAPPGAAEPGAAGHPGRGRGAARALRTGRGRTDERLARAALLSGAPGERAA